MGGGRQRFPVPRPPRGTHLQPAPGGAAYLLVGGHGGQTAPGAGVGQEAGGAGAQPGAALAPVGEHPGRRGGRPGAGGAGRGRQVRVLLVRRGREAALPDAARVLQQRGQRLLGGGAVQLLVHLVGDGPGHRAHDHVARGRRQQGAAAQQPGEAGDGPRGPLAAAHGHLAAARPAAGTAWSARAAGESGSAPLRRTCGTPDSASDRLRIPGRGPHPGKPSPPHARREKSRLPGKQIPLARCTSCSRRAQSPHRVPGPGMGSFPVGWHGFCSQTVVGVQIPNQHTPLVTSFVTLPSHLTCLCLNFFIRKTSKPQYLAQRGDGWDN